MNSKFTEDTCQVTIATPYHDYDWLRANWTSQLASFNANSSCLSRNMTSNI